MFDKNIVINVSSFDSQTQLNCQQIYCLHEFSFHSLDKQMTRDLPIQINEISNNQDKSINETSVSSISTDWSIQSIQSNQINRFLLIYRLTNRCQFLSIDYSGFIAWSSQSDCILLFRDPSVTFWPSRIRIYVRDAILVVRSVFK